MKKLAVISLVLLISMVATACGPKAEPFECTDEWGCVTIAPEDPVRIGYALVISGPNESLGMACVHGIEIAVNERGKLLDHPIEIVGEDSLCSAEGGQTAVTKLVSDPSLLGIVGPNCSSAGVPASKIAADANVVMVSPSNTAPSLTHPDSHQKTYLRSCHNDNVQGKAMATFVYEELGLRTAATIHDGSPYADQLQQVFADSFKEMGGTITSQEAVNVGDTDMRPILTTIAADSPELIYYPIFIAEGGFITVQAQEIDGLENTVLAGADGMMSPDFVEAAGEASEGMYTSGPDLSFDNDIAVRFMETYKEEYGGEPTSVFYAHAYDGANMILNAVEKVAEQDDDGTLHIGRKALNDAMFATSGFEGITGELNCDEYGDCADPKIAVNEIQNGEYVPVWTD